jgi:CRISPR/Cas system CSM-associated protein Csm3 (group 7 of RAMP superfamily)
MNSFVYHMYARIVFPEGLTPGSGAFSNKINIAKDGAERPVLRGTAISGVIRHAYEDELKRKGKHPSESNNWFGRAVEDDQDDVTSLFSVADAVVDVGRSGNTTRMHNTVNRHTGAPIPRGLFSVETLPPGSQTVFHFSVACEKEKSSEYDQFVSTISEILKSEPIFGGCGNRGVGRAVVDGDILVEKFDLSTAKDYAAWLDSVYQLRKEGPSLKGSVLETAKTTDRLRLDIVLGTPRGEDIVVGDQHGLDYDLEPQTAIFTDGTTHFRIPGSSLRGVFRAWMTRLAAREGCEISDSYTNFDQSKDYKPDSRAWGFVHEERRTEYQKDPKKLNDPILSLFGSMYSRGRIHISDAYSSEIGEGDVSVRKHVAVDRFYGGAKEGALFTNSVLAMPRHDFPVSITVASPTKQEARWLSKTLRAMHMGLLAFGSSKASGRLAIKRLCVAGPQSHMFEALANDLKVNQ